MKSPNGVFGFIAEWWITIPFKGRHCRLIVINSDVYIIVKKIS
jgi:hypothetical protein